MTKIKNLEKLDKKLEKPFYALISISIGFLIAFIIILCIGENPLEFVSNIFRGSFYSLEAFGNFLATFSWMLLVGLSVAVSFRAGLFNIGVAGQMIAGGIGGFFWGYFVDIGRASIIGSIFIPLIIGMTIASFIGFLKVKLGVNEVISSIMINWVIYYFYRFFTNPTYFTSIVDSSSGSTNSINQAASLQAPWLNNIFGENSFINIGIIIVIIVFIGIYILYRFTTWGFKQDLLGSNPKASKYVGINSNRELIKSMALSGALAGLAGSIYYLGVKECLPAIGADIPAEGFNGITISLIAFNSPLGVLFSSVFVALLYNSSLMVSSTLDPKITNLILGIIILVISLSQFLIIYKPFSKIKFFKKDFSEKPILIPNNSNASNREFKTIEEQISETLFSQTNELQFIDKNEIQHDPPSKINLISKDEKLDQSLKKEDENIQLEQQDLESIIDEFISSMSELKNKISEEKIESFLENELNGGYDNE